MFRFVGRPRRGGPFGLYILLALIRALAFVLANEELGKGGLAGWDFGFDATTVEE